jgi:hypothetical protein
MEDDLEIYDTIFESLEDDDHAEYAENEMEKISKKILGFIHSLDADSLPRASKCIALLIYNHYKETQGKIRIVPYRGKCDRESQSLDFDLRYIPPVLARIISKWIDESIE